MKRILIFVLLAMLASCSLFKKKTAAGNNVIARVNGDYLYAEEVLPITHGLKGADSIAAVKSYAEDWVRKKLLLQKATENVADDDPGIVKKVEEYRESLVLYEYEKALLSQKLDTAISENELADAYDKMKGDFTLNNDLYRILFIKVKEDAPDLNLARKWIAKPAGEEDLRKLDGYCQEYATTYSLEPGMWYEKDNAVKNFEVSEGDLAILGFSKNFKEYKTAQGYTFIKVAEVAKRDSTAPLAFIKDKLSGVILEKRKMQLLDKTYNKIYQDGLKSKAFEIFVKQ